MYDASAHSCSNLLSYYLLSLWVRQCSVVIDILLLSCDPLILVDFVEPSLIRAPFSAQIDDYLHC